MLIKLHVMAGTPGRAEPVIRLFPAGIFPVGLFPASFSPLGIFPVGFFPR